MGSSEALKPPFKTPADRTARGTFTLDITLVGTDAKVESGVWDSACPLLVALPPKLDVRTKQTSGEHRRILMLHITALNSV